MTAPVVPRPNFLIIGAARSGTTALSRFIGQHPDAFMADPKEPHFLALGHRQAPFTGLGDDEMMNRRIVTDADRYQKLFAHAGGATARGEGSVSTLYYGHDAIERIDRYCDPDVKLIAILRHPVERAFSAYLYLRGRGREPVTDFATALTLEAERQHAGWHHMWHYTAMSRYSEQLPRFVDAFGPRLKVVLHDDLEQHPQATMAEIFTFLGLSPFEPSTALEINRSGEARNAVLHRLMLGIRSIEPVRAAVKRVTSAGLRDRVRAANLQRPVLTSDLRTRLLTEFAADIDYVHQLTGGRCEEWHR